MPRAHAAQHIATATLSLNAAVACALGDLADTLEAGLAAGKPLKAAIRSLLAKLFVEHLPVVFDGNGSSPEAGGG